MSFVDKLSREADQSRLCQFRESRTLSTRSYSVCSSLDISCLMSSNFDVTSSSFSSQLFVTSIYCINFFMIRDCLRERCSILIFSACTNLFSTLLFFLSLITVLRSSLSSLSFCFSPSATTRSLNALYILSTSAYSFFSLVRLFSSCKLLNLLVECRSFCSKSEIFSSRIWYKRSTQLTFLEILRFMVSSACCRQLTRFEIFFVYS